MLWCRFQQEALVRPTHREKREAEIFDFRAELPANGRRKNRKQSYAQ